MKLEQGQTPPDWLAIPDPTASFAASGTDAGALPPIAKLPVSPTRAELHRRRLLAFALACGWCALPFALGLGGRPDLGHIAPFVLAQSAFYLALVAIASAAAWASGRSGIGMSVARLAAVIVLVPGAFVSLALLWTAPGSATWSLGGADRLLPCTIIGSVMALPVLLLAGWASAHSFVSRSRARGAALGAASGLMGAAVLLLHCGNGYGGHVALAHGLIGRIPDTTPSARAAGALALSQTLRVISWRRCSARPITPPGAGEWPRCHPAEIRVAVRPQSR
jgi:hypothetical protein